jgi:hypothetical protein
MPVSRDDYAVLPLPEPMRKCQIPTVWNIDRPAMQRSVPK